MELRNPSAIKAKRCSFRMTVIREGTCLLTKSISGGGGAMGEYAWEYEGLVNDLWNWILTYWFDQSGGV